MNLLYRIEDFIWLCGTTNVIKFVRIKCVLSLCVFFKKKKEKGGRLDR